MAWAVVIFGSAYIFPKIFLRVAAFCGWVVLGLVGVMIASMVLF